jgi:hypothetical protein
MDEAEAEDEKTAGRMSVSRSAEVPMKASPSAV